MYQVESFIEPGAEEKVYHLNKSIYRLTVGKKLDWYLRTVIGLKIETFGKR